LTLAPNPRHHCFWNLGSHVCIGPDVKNQDQHYLIILAKQQNSS
jgi:hypothetical protein